MSNPETDNRSPSPPPESRSPSPAAGDELTLRALVSTKDAGVIIGKGGKNVAELREQSAVKAGVSKRILTVSGSPEAVAKAYTAMISQLVTSTPPSPSPVASSSSSHTSIRLLISHNLMGTIIGRNGLRIKTIQDASGARMIASKDMLPNSTERIVEVQGSPDVIGKAIEEIGKSLLEDWERGAGTVLYQPGTADATSSNRRSINGLPTSPTTPRRPGVLPLLYPPPLQSNLRTQNISIPSDMVGCIIGRGGSKITEIRRLSGSKISIAKTPHDETGERMFTIVGTPEANEKALFLLYNQLESEKERRVGRESDDAQE
ncbi:hypothetical protein DL96DRAFT_1575228 [Flagelloscypha sp. PMI_526]|nr:hypothetical protein DL96DRAFT_1575228 [Flagelloscypha sp. PMI_526]